MTAENKKLLVSKLWTAGITFITTVLGVLSTTVFGA